MLEYILSEVGNIEEGDANMPYTVFEKRNTRTTSPTITITKSTRIVLNVAATRIFHKAAVEYVLLLWDEDNRKFALRPIGKKDSRAYRVTYGKNQNGCSFSGKSFLDFIGFDYSKKFSMPATWNEEEGILEATVPPDHMKQDKQRKPVTFEIGKKQSKVG